MHADRKSCMSLEKRRKVSLERSSTGLVWSNCLPLSDSTTVAAIRRRLESLLPDMATNNLSLRDVAFGPRSGGEFKSDITLIDGNGPPFGCMGEVRYTRVAERHCDLLAYLAVVVVPTVPCTYEAFLSASDIHALTILQNGRTRGYLIERNHGALHKTPWWKLFSGWPRHWDVLSCDDNRLIANLSVPKWPTNTSCALFRPIATGQPTEFRLAGGFLYTKRKHRFVIPLNADFSGDKTMESLFFVIRILFRTHVYPFDFASA